MFHKNEGKLIQRILKLICKENIRHTVIYKKSVKKKYIYIYIYIYNVMKSLKHYMLQRDIQENSVI